MQQPPAQGPRDPNSQLWQTSPYGQPEQLSEPSPQPERQQSQNYPPQQMYQPPAPHYNPGLPGTPQQQPQAYPQQQLYQQPASYNPAIPGTPWQQPQAYPQQQIYQQPVQVTSVNVNVNAQQKNNGCVRALYFVFIGWWLGFWCLEIGFFLCAIIITLPVGLMILNRLPQIMTLKPPTQTVQTNVNVTSLGSAGNAINVNVNVTGVQQHPMLLRAVYYIFVGCWVGYLWASLAYFFCLTILGLPLGIIMLNQLPAVLTLRKN